MGFSKARTLEWGAFPVSRGIFPTRGWNPGLPHCRRILYHLSHEGSTSLYICTYIYVLLRKRKKYTRTLVETASLVSATQLCLTLCDPMDCSLPGSSVHGILARQAYWSGLPCLPPSDLPDPGTKPTSPALAGGFFTPEPPGKSMESV